MVTRLREEASTVHGKYRLAAAVYDGKYNIISIGTNSYVKTHPLQARYGAPHRLFIHAEIQAIVRSNGKEKRGIAVVRTTNDGRLAIAKPCDACLAAILEAGLKEIVYSDYDGNVRKLRIGGKTT